MPTEALLAVITTAIVTNTLLVLAALLARRSGEEAIAEPLSAVRRRDAQPGMALAPPGPPPTPAEPPAPIDPLLLPRLTPLPAVRRSAPSPRPARGAATSRPTARLTGGVADGAARVVEAVPNDADDTGHSSAMVLPRPPQASVALPDAPAPTTSPPPEPPPSAIEAAPEPRARTGRTRAAPRPPATDEGPAPKATRRTATRGSRGRAKFTLPSIEVDHERTERVVLGLLSGEIPPAGEEGIAGAWDRVIGRSGDAPGDRPAVVVAVGIDGLDAVLSTAGRESADRLVTPVLDALRRSARSTDRVASVGLGHFRVLLAEADDAAAARFVSRVRGAVDRRLSLAPAPVHLAAGWSSVRGAADLEVAVHAAEEARRRDAAGAARTEGASPA